jgi:hypothetical protein
MSEDWLRLPQEELYRRIRRADERTQALLEMHRRWPRIARLVGRMSPRQLSWFLRGLSAARFLLLLAQLCAAGFIGWRAHEGWLQAHHLVCR